MRRPCEYQNLFGAPDTGVHSIRLFNIALVDVFFTFLGALLLKYLIFKATEYWKVLLGLFLFGVFLHWFFCVPTTVNKFLGLV